MLVEEARYFCARDMAMGGVVGEGAVGWRLSSLAGAENGADPTGRVGAGGQI